MAKLAQLPTKGSYWYTFCYPNKVFSVFQVKYAGIGSVVLKRIESYSTKVSVRTNYQRFGNEFKKLTQRGVA